MDDSVTTEGELNAKLLQGEFPYRRSYGWITCGYVCV